MDIIETLLSDDQEWFQDKLNQLIDKGYDILFVNTNLGSCGRITWTAILKK